MVGPCGFRDNSATGLGRDPVTGVEWIGDRQQPSHRDWKVDSTLPYLKLSEDYAIVKLSGDYAIVARVLVVVAAGIVQYRTMAAGEFLSNPVYLEGLARHAPANRRRMNMEAVIATKVIDGNSGPPRLVASYFW
jgi:hypothetical protein